MVYDYKKIIKAFRCLTEEHPGDCNKCPYETDCTTPLYEDAANMIQCQADQITELESIINEIHGADMSVSSTGSQIAKAIRDVGAGIIEALWMYKSESGGYGSEDFSILASQVREGIKDE